jgi:hypothetical protein
MSAEASIPEQVQAPRRQDRPQTVAPRWMDTTYMQPDPVDLDHLSQVISHATAPAFLLGAVSGFVAVLMSRMNGIIERIRSLNGIADDDEARVRLKADLPRLKRRAKLTNDAIYFAVGSALCTTALVITAFISAVLGFRHEPGAAVLFVLALGLLGVSLFDLGREVRIALSEFDHHG